MNYSILSEKLKSGSIVYLVDDSENVAIRLIPINGKVKAYIKHIGKSEIKISQTDNAVFNVVLSGNEISKIEYDKY